MPVFNEGRGITSVLSAWTDVLRSLNVAYEVRLYNDGSTDSTPAVLDDLEQLNPAVHVIHQDNRGHGPTILRAYGEATGAWVFQVDSDDEIPASMFEDVWGQRAGMDAVFGVRCDRKEPLTRRLVTWGAWAVVRTAYGHCPRDVNVRFRLIRQEVLSAVVSRLPDDLFAPNVAMTGLLSTSAARVVEVPVLTQRRAFGSSSLAAPLKLMKVALLTAKQTLGLALKCR